MMARRCRWCERVEGRSDHIIDRLSYWHLHGHRSACIDLPSLASVLRLPSQARCLYHAAIRSKALRYGGSNVLHDVHANW